MAEVALVGAGPAGLMAAEVLGAAGVEVHVYDAMPSVGRKFLLAGKGGLNLTHSEPPAQFEARYGARQVEVARALRQFDPDAIRAWAASLGVQTFVGTSGRVFPTDMKAAPLLRAWLHRLRHPAQGRSVQFHMRQRWSGFDDTGGTAKIGLRFDGAQGASQVRADAVVLALGGASWARLGSDGAWVEPLRAHGVDIAPLLPANCGFDVVGGWSRYFAERFAGMPFKSVALRVDGSEGQGFYRKGEFVATATGIEGSLVYAAAQLLREQITAQGVATLSVDLLPAWSAQRVLSEVSHPRGSRSLSSHLKSRLALDGIKTALLYEVLGKDGMAKPGLLAQTIKAAALRLSAPRPIDEAISSAGGVRFEAMDARLMLTRLPGVFCAGEMLDWEAPTGGYLISAALATGLAAARGVLDYIDQGR